MELYIDFSSAEAIYLQLCNQIILGIAAERFKEGDSLPSVRQLADDVGINMHTVNKAYAILRQEGFVKLDRRKGAVICIDVNKMRQIEQMRKELEIVVARAICNGVERSEAHQLIDELYDDFNGGK